MTNVLSYVIIPNNNNTVQNKTQQVGGEKMSKLYTCEEIANRYSVKLITVWDWIRKKKLPAVKIGREYRIREEDVKEFEDSRRTV